MAKLPSIVTSFGIDSDYAGEEFRIFFLSIHNSRKLFLGDEEVTENLGRAIVTNDINEATQKLGELLDDNDFMEYLESEFCL